MYTIRNVVGISVQPDNRYVFVFIKDVKQEIPPGDSRRIDIATKSVTLPGGFTAYEAAGHSGLSYVHVYDGKGEVEKVEVYTSSLGDLLKTNISGSIFK